MRYKTKLLLSTIALSAFTMSSQASELKSLVPALKSSVQATSKAVSFPPILTQYMLTGEREARLYISLSSFSDNNPGYRAEFTPVSNFVYEGYIWGSTIDIIPFQFGSFPVNINIIDTASGDIVDVQNYNIIVNETSKFTASVLPDEVELEINERTHLELSSNYRFSIATIDLPPNFEIDFENDTGRIFAIEGAFTEPGIYFVNSSVESWNGEVIQQTTKFVIKDSLTPDLEVVDTNYLTTRYNETLEIDLSQNISGRYDQILIHKDVDFGSISLSGDKVTYYAPSELIHNLDNFRVEVIDSLTNTRKYFEVNIRVEAVAPQVADFTVNGNRYKEVIIDFNPYITKGTFDINNLDIPADYYGTLNVIGNNVVAFKYNNHTRDAHSFSFSYSVASLDGSTSDYGNVTINIPAAETVALIENNVRVKVGDPVDMAFVAEGGSAPYTYTVSGYYPEGIALVDGNRIAGTPLASGHYEYYVEVTDINGEFAYHQYTLEVYDDTNAELPVVESGKLELDYGQSGSIDLSSLIKGDFDSISITKSAEKGDVKLSGNTATFTPSEGAVGSDKFDFVAANAAGSVTGSVLISIKEPVGEAPIAINHVISLDPTKSGSIDLTSGAISSDPILKFHILNSVSAKTTGKIELSGSVLRFQPHRVFAGNLMVEYQLENKFGRSNVATVTFKVGERPDPSINPELVALIKAQVDAAIDLADDQIDNILRRLQQIRSEAPGKRLNSLDLTIGVDSDDNSGRQHDGTEIENKSSQNIKSDFESESPLATWMTGYVRVGESELGGLDFKTTALGFTAGTDYRFNENFVGGVTLGYGREHSKIGENGTENVATAISTALYGSWHSRSGAFVDGLIGYQKLSMDSTRFVTPNSQFAYGSRSGSVVFGSVIGGYDFKHENGLKVTPYAGMRGIFGKLDGFTESGGDIYGLTYGSTNVRSVSGVAGLGVEKTYDTDNWTITPNAKIEYRYDFASGTKTNIGYTDIISDVGMPYVVQTDVDERSTVVASAGVRVKPKNSDLTLEAAVQGNLNGNSKSVRFSAKATYSFCGIGAKKTDCMSLEQRVVYLKAELAKAEKVKNVQQISKIKKLLAKTEKELKAFNKRSSQLTPIPDPDYTFRLK